MALPPRAYAKLEELLERASQGHNTDAVESAGRKFKRLLRDDHWKSQKSVHSTT